MSKKALLLICDGWGIGDRGKDDVIYNTPTPYWDELLKTYPNSQLQASGENVGLPDGQMGNSEVGHLNIGAGRIVYQDLVKINIACRQNTILDNPEIKRAYSYAKENGKQIHFMGLVSDGGCTQLIGTPVQTGGYRQRIRNRQSICSLLYGRSRHGPEKR